MISSIDPWSRRLHFTGWRWSPESCARVFGSIFVERMLDLGAIGSYLLIGLFSTGLGLSGGPAGGMELVALNAGVFAGLAMLAFAVFRSGTLERFSWPEPVAAVLNDFRTGLRP